MNTLLNVLWLIFGGFVAGLGWLIAAVILVITVVGIPWARAAANIGLFTFWPFGREAVARDEHSGEDDIGTGALGLLGNILWFLFAGVWLAIGHALVGIGLLITIIGIPFGVQHFKLAGIALAPIGKTIVDK